MLFANQTFEEVPHMLNYGSDKKNHLNVNAIYMIISLQSGWPWKDFGEQCKVYEDSNKKYKISTSSSSMLETRFPI